MSTSPNDNVSVGGAVQQLPGPLDYTPSDFTLLTVTENLADGNSPSPGTKAISVNSPAVTALSPLFDFITTSTGDRDLPASAWLQVLLPAADRGEADVGALRNLNVFEDDLTLITANVG